MLVRWFRSLFLDTIYLGIIPENGVFFKGTGNGEGKSGRCVRFLAVDRGQPKY